DHTHPTDGRPGLDRAARRLAGRDRGQAPVRCGAAEAEPRLRAHGPGGPTAPRRVLRGAVRRAESPGAGALGTIPADGPRRPAPARVLGRGAPAAIHRARPDARA